MPVLCNSRGFTLLEFLVAVLIAMVGLLGLLQTVNVALNHNLQNQLRNEAVQVADSYMARELAKGFDAVSTHPPLTPKYLVESRQILNGFRNFSVAHSGITYENSKEIRFQVIWRHKGTRYTHDAAGVVSKAQQ
ncbi:type IV pilus modification PilV family protein [Trichlorobacter ammonificans]|uniref:Type IV fimbrial biogenesis protein PilW n=1 Tax=Trichlorobacter ammonificans TaxID=2916410 RepID=A0ABM9D5X1_9BACT|nr:prepilin-type N-terminal cleavage/methylation domain-containing protein [Trichlorobacter ammonificans]CAH2030120.1 Type IV fimbrial biogenesis protein PilW [Trichlorobacter ammonificans]